MTRPPLGQVVKLHQRFEGESVCCHCGKPLPWPEMDPCRDRTEPDPRAESRDMTESEIASLFDNTNGTWAKDVTK